MIRFRLRFLPVSNVQTRRLRHQRDSLKRVARGLGAAPPRRRRRHRRHRRDARRRRRRRAERLRRAQLRDADRSSATKCPRARRAPRRRFRADTAPSLGSRYASINPSTSSDAACRPAGSAATFPPRRRTGPPPSLPGLIEQLVPTNVLVRVIPARAWSAAPPPSRRRRRSRCPLEVSRSPARRSASPAHDPRRRLVGPRRLRRLLERVVRDEQPRRDARLVALRAPSRRGGGGGLGAFGSFDAFGLADALRFGFRENFTRLELVLRA